MRKISTPEAEQMCYELKENGVMYRDIKKQLSQELGINLSPERINFYRNKIKKELGGETIKQQTKISDMNDMVDIDKWRYEIEGENVVFYKNIPSVNDEKVKKKFSISIKELGDIVYDYSANGNNMTGRQILRKHSLNRELRSLIKGRLYVTKDENACPDIILDYIKENYGTKAQEEKIIEVSSKAMHDKYKPQREEQYNLLWKKEAEKAIRILKSTEAYLNLVQDHIKNWKPAPVQEFAEIVDNHKTLFVAFGDLHFGRTTEGLKKRVDKLEQRIIARPETNVILKCMGDILETIVQGGMHSGQVEEMDVLGIQQLLDAAKTLEDFLINIRKSGKQVRMDGVTGNHDRISKIHNEDTFRLGGVMFYELLKKALQNTDIKINYTIDAIFKSVDEGVNWIQHHGDNRFDKKKSEEVLNFHGEYGIHNVILEGDKHNAKLSEGKNYTRITVASMNEGNRYSEEGLMLSAEPGVTFATVNEDGLPEPQFIRL